MTPTKTGLVLEGEATTADCSGMSLESIEQLPPALRKLDVSNNLLTNNGKLNFSGAVKLTQLDMKSNKLKTLAGLESLKSIQVLTLAFNEITSITSITSFGTNLKALVLNNNSLSSLPDLSPLMNLNTLILSHNKFTSLPRPFPRLPQLKKLSVSHNQLEDYPLFPIPAPPIQELRMSNNKIKSLPSKNPKVACTHTLPSLKTLDMGSNGIDSVKNLVAGLAVICAPNSLFNLSFKGNPVTGVVDGESSPSYKHAVIQAAGSKLSILDNVRFDAKFLARKEDREKSKQLLLNGKGVEDGEDEDEEVEVETPAPQRKAVASKPKTQKQISQPLKKSDKPVLRTKALKKATGPETKKSQLELDPAEIVAISKPPKLVSQSGFKVTKRDAGRDSNSKLSETKRKADASTLLTENPNKKRTTTKSADSFFAESFGASIKIPPNPTSTTTSNSTPAISKEKKKEEKSLGQEIDKVEEKLRSGVVGVVEVKKPIQTRIGGAKVIVKPVNVEELEKNAAANEVFGGNVASGWD